MSNQSLIDLKRPLNVCRASAGTGKTYTLAAYYIGLLLSGVDYRSILAVTFTNNATSEMKERIMDYLFQLKDGKNGQFLKRARDFMIDHQADSEQVLQQRAGECFRRMLLDYDNVHVQTIDSFLLNLQNGLAAVLKMSAGYSPELDSKRVITQAVDQLLSVDMTENAKNLLENYAMAKIEEESKDEIRKALIDMAQELYNESVQMLDADNLILFDSKAIDAYRNRLDEAWQNNEDVADLKKALSQMSEIDIEVKNEKNVRKAYNKLLVNLRASIDNPKSVDKKDRFQCMSDTNMSAAQEKLKDLYGDIVKITQLAAQCMQAYNTYCLSKEFTYDMQLMAELRAIINRNLIETNKTLLAQTASLLRNAMKDGDADFILEKAGIRYHHVLLDEFQDTSKLQWSVFNLLIKELVSGTDNSILVVGDIKQSIYRWRNGDWHTMSDLGQPGNYYQDYYNAEFLPLSRNFRSSKEVVNFNLSLFKKISEQYGDFGYGKDKGSPSAKEAQQVKQIYDEGFDPTKVDDFYKSDDDNKKGGFVCVRAFVKENNKNAKPQMAENMFDEMERLLEQGVAPKQMMILVRFNSEIGIVTDMFNRLDKDKYPKLKQTRLATENSYLLSSSLDVRTIVAILYYFAIEKTKEQSQEPQNSVNVEFISKRLPDFDFSQQKDGIKLTNPLFETISDILRLYFCDEQGQYTGTENAYIDTFLDYVRSYVASEGGKVEDFLTYWEDVLCEKSIPMSAVDAIRVMTVHKSKGLEAQTLFIPFCNWEMDKPRRDPKVWCESVLPKEDGSPAFLPIKYGDAMMQSDYKNEFEEERHNLRIDNLNLLYVALTRARDNLFVFVDCNKSGASTNIGQYLLSHLRPNIKITEDMPYGEYVSGELTIAKEKAAAEESPFSFNAGEECVSQLWSDGKEVKFVQSTDSLRYYENGDEVGRLEQRKEIGNICHEVFGRLTDKIISYYDWKTRLNAILDDFETQGLIESAEQRKQVYFLVSKAWSDPQMQQWFKTPYQVEAEHTIYINGCKYRPDRVMIDQVRNKAIVIDYKFGKQNDDKYSDQVRRYMHSMRLMGYSDVEGYLWYAKNENGKQLKRVEEEQQ